MLGTRDPQKPEVRKWLKEHKGAQAGTFAETARFADLARHSGQRRRKRHSSRQSGEPGGQSHRRPAGVLPFSTGPNESLGEKVQAAAPQSHVVKAFNSVGNAQMVNPHYQQGTPTMFYCGNDSGAKAKVAEIVTQFGWEPFDCGGIIASRALEPLCMLWCLPGFLRNQWTHAFKVLTH